MDLNLGAHCSVKDCNLRDFLPFSCDSCGGVHCLEHRTYAGHNCAHAHAKQQLAIRCPICHSTLQLRGDEDPNIVWEQHRARDGCDPSKRKKKVRCPANGNKCKTVLGPTNTATCVDCGQQLCLQHRHQRDHACPGRPSRGVAAWFSNRSAPAPAPAPAPVAHPRTAPPAPAARPSRPVPLTARAPGPTNTLRGSADRRRGNGAPGGAYPGQAYRQQEDVIDLTGDVSPPRPSRAQQQQHQQQQQQHQHQQQQQQPGVTVDGGCPFCAAVFVDPVALVAHVESAHPEGSRMPPEHSSYCHVG